MCAVGTVQVGYAISNMEPVSLVKLVAPGVTATAVWAGPLEVVHHHLILLYEGMPETVILNNIPTCGQHTRHLQRDINYWVCCMGNVLQIGLNSQSSW